MREAVPHAVPIEGGERWDAVVIGAGPAGCLAATLLARAGLRTLLVEKTAFPRVKVCGCCLNQAALALLDEAGVGETVRALPGQRLDSLLLASRGRSATLSTRPGLAIGRAAFDAALAEEARRAGAVFRDGLAASIGASRSAARTVTLTGAESSTGIPARVVLCADGLAGSALRALPEFANQPRPGSRIGLGAVVPRGVATAPPHTIHMACAPRGYVGWVDLGDGTLAIGAAVDAPLVRDAGGPGLAIASLWEDARIANPPYISAADWRGTPQLTRTLSAVEADRLFLIGDATGYVEPFTGEGMSWALWSAVACVPHVLARVHGEYRAGEWTESLRTGLSARRRRCGAVASLLRHPTLVSAGIGIAAAWPRLGSAISGRFGAPWPVQPSGVIA